METITYFLEKEKTKPQTWVSKQCDIYDTLKIHYRKYY